MIETLQPLADALVSYVTANPEQSFGVAVGVAGVGANYMKTGKFPIGRLPYKYLREMLRDFGDRYFKASRPRGVPVVVAHAPPKAVKRALNESHYESSDLFSYEYDGELYNLRRPEGHSIDPKHGGEVLMENHTRLFETDSGETLILTHHEANRYLETTEHLADQGLSWQKGRELITTDLETMDIAYTKYDSESLADVTVVS